MRDLKLWDGSIPEETVTPTKVTVENFMTVVDAVVSVVSRYCSTRPVSSVPENKTIH